MASGNSNSAGENKSGAITNRKGIFQGSIFQNSIFQVGVALTEKTDPAPSNNGINK